ncbi:MAG: hypothetical protein FD174_3527 [Geobacteraceae bacterium]|nr:MAG: hypothetical protein FD174_3527 [Geobacteraceae bacterium]
MQKLRCAKICVEASRAGHQFLNLKKRKAVTHARNGLGLTTEQKESLPPRYLAGNVVR